MTRAHWHDSHWIATSVDTETADSIFLQCVIAVRDTIRALGLAGIDAANIVWRKHPWNVGEITAGIFVTPPSETLAPVSNLRDDVGYGVQVTMVQASNQALTTNAGRLLLWREQIRKAFSEKRLTGVSSVYRCKVEPASVFWPEGFRLQYDVGALLIRCYSRE
jgi:hypothetical protein